MFEKLAEIASLSREWDVNEEDILLIALNHCGLRSTIPKSRMRFRLRLRERPEENLFFILSLGRTDSPFELREDVVLFRGTPIADVTGLEDDDAVLGYFRKGRRVLTLNSNARSQCTGCVFCPNTLEAASDPRLAALDDLTSYFAAITEDFDLGDLSGVEKVTICTGCFHHEPLALEHLRAVRNAMTAHGCEGMIHFLSSVLRTEEGLDAAAAIGPFHLTLTIECFGRRNIMLKNSKAELDADDMEEILCRAKARGVVADYTYIIGLDSPETMMRHLPNLVPHTTTFPRFQVLQPHNAFMDTFVGSGGTQIEYYLGARKYIESLFVETDLRPQSWENYRPLWYFTFADELLSSVRI